MANEEKQIKMIMNGVVIDHIPNEHFLKILQLLRLDKIKNPVAVGFNLTSNRLGTKAIIKMDNGYFTPQQKANIALFAHGATYNIIEGGEVVSKEVLTPTEEVNSRLICPNSRCVSRVYKSTFIPCLNDDGSKVEAICKYCELQFSLADLKEFVK